MILLDDLDALVLENDVVLKLAWQAAGALLAVEAVGEAIRLRAVDAVLGPLFGRAEDRVDVLGTLLRI